MNTWPILRARKAAAMKGIIRICSLVISMIMMTAVRGAWMTPEKNATMPSNAQTLKFAKWNIFATLKPSPAPIDKQGEKIPPAIPDRYDNIVVPNFSNPKRSGHWSIVELSRNLRVISYPDPEVVPPLKKPTAAHRIPQ